MTSVGGVKIRQSGNMRKGEKEGMKENRTKKWVARWRKTTFHS